MNKPLYSSPYLLFSDGIGDCFFNLPAMRALSEFFEGRLTLICTKGIADLFFRDLSLRRIIEIPNVVVPDNRKEAVEICKREITSCDLFIYINPYFFTELLDLIDYLDTETMGYFEPFKIQVPMDQEKHSLISHFNFSLYFNNQLNLTEYSYPPTYKFSDGDIAKRIIDSIPPDNKLLIVHPDTTKEFKTWAYPNYNTLFDMILDRYPLYIIMLVGNSVLNTENCLYKDRIFSAADLPLEINLDLIKHAGVFIGIDSCFLHAADFFRIPSVGIFANEYSSRRYGLALTQHHHVFSETTDINLVAPIDVYNAFSSLVEVQNTVPIN
ncbi:hypothetical protein KHS38_21260 [Mucilaginibacter sp. Bleaf8]|uniref:glycosyltransferase family 9 protein n=1 Tax=Mucilaginibacter sp. Bleaf8 TaxID=2834430 RepID=UPI001BCAC854|nr:glycosyltransferase family 9 protein [Mucilaginibacter sp. Bleaf8]MBS7566948.1 hypothetical protein [Mucilaginibacter sp. Bleaf8]